MGKAWKIFMISAALILFIGMFLVPGGSDHPRSGKELMTKATMSGLIIAIRGFQTEYARLPIMPKSDSAFIESRGSLLTILMAEEEIHNIRKIKFYDPPPSKNGRSGAARNTANEWELRDQWGNFYHLYFDVDDDGKIPNPARGTSNDEPETLSTKILIFSAGPDGDFTTWKDNIRSWQ